MWFASSPQFQTPELRDRGYTVTVQSQRRAGSRCDTWITSLSSTSFPSPMLPNPKPRHLIYHGAFDDRLLVWKLRSRDATEPLKRHLPTCEEPPLCIDNAPADIRI